MTYKELYTERFLDQEKIDPGAQVSVIVRDHIEFKREVESVTGARNVKINPCGSIGWTAYGDTPAGRLCVYDCGFLAIN